MNTVSANLGYEIVKFCKKNKNFIRKKKKEETHGPERAVKEFLEKFKTASKFAARFNIESHVIEMRHRRTSECR